MAKCKSLIFQTLSLLICKKEIILIAPTSQGWYEKVRQCRPTSLNEVARDPQGKIKSVRGEENHYNHLYSLLPPLDLETVSKPEPTSLGKTSTFKSTGPSSNLALITTILGTNPCRDVA